MPKLRNIRIIDGEHGEELIRFATDHMVDWGVPDDQIAQFQAEAREGDARQVLNRWVHLFIQDGLEEEIIRKQSQPSRIVPEDWLEVVTAGASRNLGPAINKLRELIGERHIFIPAGRGSAKTLQPVLVDLIAQARAKGIAVPRALDGICRMIESDKGGAPKRYWTLEQVKASIHHDDGGRQTTAVVAFHRFMEDRATALSTRVAHSYAQEATRLAVEKSYGTMLDPVRHGWLESKLEAEILRRRHLDSKKRKSSRPT